MKASKNALPELQQLRGGEQSSQLGLPDDSDLQQLGVVGLQIADHAQLLERADRQA